MVQIKPSTPGEPEMITSCRQLLAVAETNPELFRRLVRGETEDIDPDLVRHMERVRNSLQGQ